MTASPNPKRADGLESRHGFFGRAGGVSEGPWASLNCGLSTGDRPDHVAENRLRAARAIAPDARLVLARQVHSAIAVEADAWADGAAPQADALVSRRADLLLGVLTADCAPILMEDRGAGVVAAAHAGWRGALDGVIEATVALMEQLGARRERIAAAIGPAIAQPSYEVDRPFKAAFLAADAAYARFFGPGRPGHAFFDLEGFCAARLEEAGVGHVERLGIDTMDDGWFSHRRATRAGATTGRQLSAIAPG